MPYKKKGVKKMYNQEIQQQIIEEMKVMPVIDPNKERVNRIAFLTNYLQKYQLNGFVLGLSGGQDSTLAGKLAQGAAENAGCKFIALRLPYGIQKDAADVNLAIEYIRPDEVYEFNIKPVVDALCTVFEQVTGNPLSDYHKGNLKARVRAVVQYAFAGERGMAVVGTDHSSENITGFFTKFGDGAADIIPLFGLSKFQGREILKTMGCPERIVTKAPTADLLDGNPCRPDEDELGITYQVLEKFLVGKTVSDKEFDAIVNQYRKTDHKRKPPVTIYDPVLE
jgi:NAD+ synthase